MRRKMYARTTTVRIHFRTTTTQRSRIYHSFTTISISISRRHSDLALNYHLPPREHCRLPRAICLNLNHLPASHQTCIFYFCTATAQQLQDDYRSKKSRSPPTPNRML